MIRGEDNSEDNSEDDPKDLDKKVPWPVAFPDDKGHREVWQKGIQTAKDMFKVDGAEYMFSTWFSEQETRTYEAGMTAERAKGILNAIDDDKFLIRVKFIRGQSRYEYRFNIIDKYEPIRESKKAGKKFVSGGPNVVLTKKTKPGFWVGIDVKFLIREIRNDLASDIDELKDNAVVYGLYRIQKPDCNRLMPMKDGTLNCVAQRVVEHFEKSKRGMD